MLHTMHGEIHGSLEYSQQTVHQPDTAGEFEELRSRRDVLDGRRENKRDMAMIVHERYGDVRFCLHSVGGSNGQMDAMV